MFAVAEDAVHDETDDLRCVIDDDRDVMAMAWLDQPRVAVPRGLVLPVIQFDAQRALCPGQDRQALAFRIASVGDDLPRRRVAVTVPGLSQAFDDLQAIIHEAQLFDRGQ